MVVGGSGVSGAFLYLELQIDPSRPPPPSRYNVLLLLRSRMLWQIMYVLVPMCVCVSTVHENVLYEYPKESHKQKQSRQNIVSNAN